MDKKLFTKHFIIAILFCACAAIAGLAAKGLMDNIKVLEFRQGELNTVKNQYDYRGLVQKAIMLREASARLGVLEVDRVTADLNILKVADVIAKEFKGAAQGNILHENGVANLSMKLSFVPKTVDEFVNMLEYIVALRDPSVQFITMSVTETSKEYEEYTVSADIILSHPYTEMEEGFEEDFI